MQASLHSWAPIWAIKYFAFGFFVDEIKLLRGSPIAKFLHPFGGLEDC